MSALQSTLIRTEGNSLIFKTTPTVGLLALTGFTDDATVNAGNQFSKVFRYSLNGALFSDWLPLTAFNLTSIVITEKNIFVAEINYTKSDNTLVATHIDIITTIGSVPQPGYYFKDSLFSQYFDINDTDALNWHINILEKIYNKGLLPNFIDRLDDFNSPEDFIALWGAVAKFFSFYVELARTFSEFYNNEKLIREFLTQRGLITSPEQTLLQLQQLLPTYYYQMGRRGTTDVMSEEVLSLIHNKSEIDEFIWCLYRKHHFGWNLGNSSPLYRGLRVNDSLNKIPWSKKYVDVAGAFSNYTNAINAVEAGSGISHFNIVGGGDIHFDSNNIEIVKVDSRLDYQLSFKIKGLAPTSTFNLQMIGYDKSGNIVEFKSRQTGLAQSVILHNASLSNNNKWLTVKAYLYNASVAVDTNDQPNVRQGQNLIFDSSIVRVGMILTVNGDAKLYDFRLLPMMTPYSRGFLQSINFISTWLVNRNGNLNGADLKDYISKYLIPYNTQIKLTPIDKYSYKPIPIQIETFRWIGIGEYCRKAVWLGADQSCEVTLDTIWIPQEETSYCEKI